MDERGAGRDPGPLGRGPRPGPPRPRPPLRRIGPEGLLNLVALAGLCGRPGSAVPRAPQQVCEIGDLDLIQGFDRTRDLAHQPAVDLPSRQPLELLLGLVPAERPRAPESLVV